MTGVTKEVDAVVAALTLAQAAAIVDAVFAYARDHGMAPIAVAAIDARGIPLAIKSDHRASMLRWEIAHAKAWGSLAMGCGSRELQKKAEVVPQFMSALQQLSAGRMVPVKGGVLIRDGHGNLCGSVGVSGDTPDNDELAAAHGIASIALMADTGAP
jgi:uncharacterized protein GlcG (DUF336 family)